MINLKFNPINVALVIAIIVTIALLIRIQTIDTFNFYEQLRRRQKYIYDIDMGLKNRRYRQIFINKRPDYVESWPDNNL